MQSADQHRMNCLVARRVVTAPASIVSYAGLINARRPDTRRKFASESSMMMRRMVAAVLAGRSANTATDTILGENIPDLFERRRCSFVSVRRIATGRCGGGIQGFGQRAQTNFRRFSPIMLQQTPFLADR
uniref:Uncharacterized protein n=1 Tax=Romanomermis culicivorax TaxID=13658 RepID=A0A915HIW0_ROMCU